MVPISLHTDPLVARGIVALFYGDGWGKSTASYGYALRSIGRRWDTSIIQFVKGHPWNRAERTGSEKLGIEWLTFTDALTWGGSNPDTLAELAWENAVERMSLPGPRLIVLDEIASAVSHKWLTVRDVVQGIRDRAQSTNIIMTGRDYHEELAQVSDTVTHFEMAKDGGRFGILSAQ